jgi:hypothetical protein
VDTTFFLATVRPDGRPHAAGVGAVWHDGDLYVVSGPGTRKSRNLASKPQCTVSVSLEGIDMVLDGEATRVTDAGTLEQVAAVYREGGWPVEVEADAFTAPYSAPAAGPPPWHLYRFAFHTVIGTASAEPHGATRWRFGPPAGRPARTPGDLEALGALVGEWTLEASLPGAGPSGVGGRCTFEWMPGGQFLVQRWQVDDPNAPDGVAIIGPDAERGGYVQHYFDSRGVARVYAMRLGDGVWSLERHTGDFTPLTFHQRFAGRISADGATIEGPWETSQDGAAWEHDFVLTYRRVAQA